MAARAWNCMNKTKYLININILSMSSYQHLINIIFSSAAFVF